MPRIHKSRSISDLRDEPTEYMDETYLGLFQDRAVWDTGEAAQARGDVVGRIKNPLTHLRQHGLLASAPARPGRLMSWHRTRNGERYAELRGQGASPRDALRRSGEAV